MRDHPRLWGSAAGGGTGLGLLIAAVLGYNLVGSGKSPNADQANTPAPHVYKVIGTCAAGACGLNEHLGPTSHSKELGQLPAGRRVDVLCQETGVTLTIHEEGSVATHDNIWDEVIDPPAPEGVAFVSDYFVSTPGDGHFSPDLPGC